MDKVIVTAVPLRIVTPQADACRELVSCRLELLLGVLVEFIDHNMICIVIKY